MLTSKSRETLSTASEISDKNSNSSKTQPIIDFSYLKSELTELNQEGNSFIKQSKLEEAKDSYLKGKEKFENVAEKIYNLHTNNDQVDQILALYKVILSKIAECFYNEKKYEDAIVYDLKLICLEPKNGETIFRLFKSYSNIGKTQQSIFYGELLCQLDDDEQDKFKNIKSDLEKEKRKLIQIQNVKNITNYIPICIIFVLSIVFFLRLKMSNK